jgi:hypothetical protein
LPTNWVRLPLQILVTAAQRHDLEAKITAMEGVTLPLEKIERPAWRAITTRAYSRVRTAGRSSRIDAHNRTFGMARNLSAAFAISLAWYAAMHHDQLEVIALLAALLLATIGRMRRSGIHFARALIIEFIDLDPVSKARPTMRQVAPESKP